MTFDHSCEATPLVTQVRVSSADSAFLILCGKDVARIRNAPPIKGRRRGIDPQRGDTKSSPGPINEWPLPPPVNSFYLSSCGLMVTSRIVNLRNRVRVQAWAEEEWLQEVHLFVQAVNKWISGKPGKSKI
ncbi:hypothetical protein E2C01_031319 [Portunus trituberculatus]|uniref:Uncharacterized protein n=1 Tax=Portunus trituberculatus TaxID=210409 RepID=A0A5B7EWI8_PORTR|nr:hypothetical protein [Portunus trituberculatus]